MEKMIKFPSIEQYRNIIKQVRLEHDYQGKDENDYPIYKHNSDFPSITFKGTVKLHGTNAGIVKYADGTIRYQSRERVLDLVQDNAGFMMTMKHKNLEPLFSDIPFTEHIAVFGEWCGSNIQKGVALTELPKMFVIFAVNVDGKFIDYNRSSPEHGIYNINDFQKFFVEVDFNNPELVQNELQELTLQVEEECPFAKQLNVSGVGEGIVWSAHHNDKYLMFKTKGQKHSVSKVVTLAAVDVDAIENISKFVEYAVTANRLQQGIDKLKELQLPVTSKSTGDFLRWVITDIIKEEEDTLVSNQLDVKKVTAAISVKARQWYFNNLEI